MNKMVNLSANPKSEKPSGVSGIVGNTAAQPSGPKVVSQRPVSSQPKVRIIS